MIRDEAAARAGAAVLRRHFEGFRAAPYRDQRGVWTIGEGLTRIGGQPVTGHTKPITAAENDAATAAEFDRSVALIGRQVALALEAGPAAALIDLCYNCGAGPLQPGAALYEALRAGDLSRAADALLSWDHVHGQVDHGLFCRRSVERLACLGQLDPRDLTAVEAAHSAIARGVAAAPAARPLAASAQQPSADALMALEAARLGLT